MALQSAPAQKEVTLTSGLDPELSPGVGTGLMEKVQALGSRAGSSRPPTALHTWANVQDPVPTSSTTPWPQWLGQEPSQ